MKSKYGYKPVKYFLITFLFTWTSWFITAYLSYQNNESFYPIFMMLGLLAPFGAALGMIFSSKNEQIKKDFVKKLINFRSIRLPSTLVAFLLVPGAIALSILISLFLGESIDQFQFVKGFSFETGSVPVLFSLILAPVFEELGWRGYGMDSLSSRFNYFKATLIFAVIWTLWHVPLFFINNYYHNELLRTNIFFHFHNEYLKANAFLVVNFMLSVFPFAFIINWMWKKNSRNILSAILLHFIANISQEALQISEITKCIETLVLILIAAIIVLQNKKMFFNNKKDAK